MARPLMFGEIEGIPEGTHFAGRKEMMATSFHRKWVYGIDGNKDDGVAAIVLSGGYEDDEDLGNVIVYTGEGGNDPTTKRQIENQSWQSSGNAGLLKSMNEGKPVRVIRGYKHKSPYSPSKGYTYAGLYSVVDAYMAEGKSGFLVCRFKLVYSGNNVELDPSEVRVDLDHSPRQRRTQSSTIVRVVRDGKLARDIKELYNYECQVCGVTIETMSGRYAEGAHIKPLGKPHKGEDAIGNLLCLCPNHHVMFDKGSFGVGEDLNLVGRASGSLHVHPSHTLDEDNLTYHRTRILKI